MMAQNMNFKQKISREAKPDHPMKSRSINLLSLPVGHCDYISKLCSSVMTHLPFTALLRAIMNVLVYSGPEVLQTSLNNTQSILRSVLNPHYTVQTISQESLASQPWSAGCALLVLPGCRELSPSPSVTIIRRYVENGGAFLALSTGATYSSSSRVLDLDSIGISGLSKDQTLRFYGKATSSYLYPGEFVGIESAKNMKVLAHIGERVAAVRYELSKGTVAVWAPGVELPRSTESEDPATVSWEMSRLSIMREILRDLGLRVPSENTDSACYPLPQFLTANPSKPEIVAQIMKVLSESMRPIEDKNDIFHFCNLGGNEALLKDSTRSSCGIQPDTSSWQPKHIIVCRDGRLPSSQQSPLFNLNDYFRELYRARDINGLHEDTIPWAMGEALFYSEVVTSTQTMFDKYV
jgi:biotin---protein ligase